MQWHAFNVAINQNISKEEKNYRKNQNQFNDSHDEVKNQ